MHHALTFRHGFCVPVLSFTAFPIHWVKTYVLCRRNGWKEPLRHGLRLAFGNFLYSRIPLRRAFGEAFFGKGSVSFCRGLVEAKFNHREVRVLGFQELMEAGLGELEFNPIELCKRISEVNEKKVSLVSQQREDG